MKRYLITSALPYINGIKHLGNLVGSLLPADVYARYLRQQGEDVLYICGTDEHGTPAEIAAQDNGLSAEQYCQVMYEKQKVIYEKFNIKFDYFGRSSSLVNHRLTQEIFEQLDKNGFIEEKEITQVYSLDDKRFLPDRYIIGVCPHCNYEKAKGDQCDGCGHLLDPTELKNPRSVISGSSNLEVRLTPHLFFKLSLFENAVAEWVDSHQNWPVVTKSIAYKWIKEGLQDRCISRDLEWGVKIPKKGYEDKVFYVWFDAPIAYISMTKEWADIVENDENAWKKWWKNNLDEVVYVQFMAKDNVPFHTVFWPAVMLGTKEKWKFADQIKGFNWLTYSGGKFSTSEKRGVFSDVALELFPSDYWRYYLLANAPESSDSDFNFKSFGSVVNKDLADVLGNFVNRVMALVKKHFDGQVPSYSVVQSDNLFSACDAELKQLESNITELKFRQAMQSLRNLWVIGNEYITKEEPWKKIKLDQLAAANVLANCLHLIRIFAITSAPFIPDIAGRLFLIFDESGSPADISFKDVLKFDFLIPGQKLFFVDENLINKIPDEKIDELTAKFSGS